MEFYTNALLPLVLWQRPWHEISLNSIIVNTCTSQYAIREKLKQDALHLEIKRFNKVRLYCAQSLCNSQEYLDSAKGTSEQRCGRVMKLFLKAVFTALNCHCAALCCTSNINYIFGAFFFQKFIIWDVLWLYH